MIAAGFYSFNDSEQFEEKSVTNRDTTMNDIQYSYDITLNKRDMLREFRKNSSNGAISKGISSDYGQSNQMLHSYDNVKRS